ncbi:peroxiredoxin [Povalibacter sp.]|uniref:peroxiredoxin n=1 Tax=Povalibacter sp. TaxID=1962978 RepID=UPI002F3F6484
MKSAFFGFLLSTAVVVPAMAALQQGDVAPNFKTQASLAGKEFTFSLGDALKKGPVVVYFYPSAYTRGCNVQAHTFAVNYDKFTAVGASVVGVSLDDIARLNEFSADPEFCAGKLPVASDTSGKIAQSFDLQVKGPSADMKDTRGAQIAHGFAERTTFIVLPNGKIAETIGGVSPTDNVQKALEAVQRLAANKQ